MPQVKMTVYRNGEYRVVACVTFFQVVDKQGKQIDRVSSIERAVETVDELAELLLY